MAEITRMQKKSWFLKHPKNINMEFPSISKVAA
jgi:hypothetical protein